MDEFDMLLKPAAKPAAGADEFDSMLAPTPRRAKPAVPAFELEAQAQLKKGVFEGVVKPAATDLLSAATDLIDFVAGGAVAMPLASFSEGVTRAQDFVEGAVGINRRTRKEAGERGLAAASAVNEKYGTPARTLLQSWGWLPKVEGAGQKAIGAVMELVDRDAAAIEERTGGAVIKEDVLSLVNTLFGAAGAKGVQAGAGRVVDAKKAKVALQELNALKAERGAEALAAEEGAVPAGRQPQPNDPTRMHQQVRDANLAAADARVNAERLAYELMRDGAPIRKVEAIVKRNPLVGVAMEEITARRQAANRFAEEPDLPPITPQGTFREGALGAMLRQPADMSPAEVALREQAQGLKRGPLGEPVDGTSAQASVAAIDYLQDRVITEAPTGPDLPPTIKRGPLGEPIEAAPTSVPGPLGVPIERTVPSRGRRGQRGEIDQRLLTIGAVGATGLGLALAMSPDDREKALAIGGGALLLGKGRELTLQAIRDMPDATPLGALLDRSPTTLATLERLPRNRFEFPVQMVEEALRRQDITKAERQVFEQILEGRPPGSPTITAKELMQGFKVATGDFELRKVKSNTYANHGLENIDRLVPDEHQFERAGVEQATIQRNPRSGLYDILDPDGELLDSISLRQGLTPDEALAEWRGRAVTALEGPEAATHIWQSPVKLGSNNHFGDPNYFAHTRVFYENGVRHVVELQSDLAQKAGKVLSAEGRAELDAAYSKLVERNNAVQAERAELSRTGQRASQEFKDLTGEAQSLIIRMREIEAKLAVGGKLEPVSPMLRDWHKRLIREELADSARSGEKTTRFADADTVAKVEEWPKTNPYTELENFIYYQRNRIQRFEDAGRTRPRDIVLADERARLADAEQKLAAMTKGADAFQPEHQGIYDRYAKDVTKFLKQLGGKHVVDSAGHGWWEVPVEGSKQTPAGPRVQQFGGLDADLARSVALIGGGAALVAYLSSPENRLKNAGIAAAITGLALFARSRSPQVADWASQAGRGAEYTLGMVSTQIGNISAPLLHRMREHERKVMTTTHDQLKAVATFIETSRALPTAFREKLDAVILSGDSAATIKLLGQSGRPDLVVEWRKARDVLNQIGKDLVQTGRLKGLIADYFPRIAIDVPGLLNALGKEDRSFLQVKLDNARARAVKMDGRDLSPLEESQIINGFLKSHSPTSGKPGFLKKRSVEEITPELVRFYATFSEALPLYIRAAVKEVERARFFGEDLVRQEGGLTNVDMSIGNLVNRERLAGKLDDAQAEKLRSLLASRFGPGERSASGLMQTAKNLTNAGLLGHVTSAVMQAGDIALSVAAHGMLPTLKSAQQVITRKPGRISVKDVGLADHITEEIVGGEKKPMTVFGRQLSSAKFLQGVFKYSGFSLVDQLGKNISIGASFEKSVRLAQTEAGVAKLRAKYGEAYGPEFPQLIADLRSRANTEAVRGLLFSELSDIQPISKIEVPQAYLDHPNGRVLYMMKTFMLKQADIVRREGFAEINRGNVAKGTSNLLRYGLALGIAGATTDFIRNWLLGRDQDLDWGAIPENALKTFGWSQFVVDKARKGQPFQAAAGLVAPPYKMWEKLVTADPQAIQYLPLAGRLLYHDAVPGQSLLGLDFGGAEKANKAYEQRRRREEKE